MLDMRTLAQSAVATGWAIGHGEMEEVLEAASAADWSSVPIRRGDAPVAELRPLPAEAAPPRSLSAMVGTGQQPLHTDGAHLRAMPDIVVLAAAVPSQTPTLLYTPSAPTHAQSHGIFRASFGRRAFYATAVDPEGRWRYDPGCMTPADTLALQATGEINDFATRAIVHEWSEPNLLLVLANRRTLHARAAAVDASTRVIRRVAYITGLDS